MRFYIFASSHVSLHFLSAEPPLCGREASDILTPFHLVEEEDDDSDEDDDDDAERHGHRYQRRVI